MPWKVYFSGTFVFIWSYNKFIEVLFPMLPYYYVFKNLPPKSRGFVRPLAFIQGIYFFLTGAWAIIDIHFFMEVTGPKTDISLLAQVSVI